MTTPATPPTRRALHTSYVHAFFSMGMMDVLVILVPLYGVSLGMSGTQIGILVGVRALLTLPFSIHAGALMDRFGTKRVMMVFAGITVLTAPLYPLLPWFPALVLLQTVCGACTSLTWLGSQALIAHIGHGDAEFLR